MPASLGDTDSSSGSKELPDVSPEKNPLVSHSHRRKATVPIRKRRVMQEIHHLQKITSRTMIPKLVFGRLVREIISSIGTEVNRMTLEALQAIQESAEMYVTQTLEDAYLLALHRKRVTLDVEDLLLIQLLRNARSR